MGRSDGVVNEPLRIAVNIEKKDGDLYFDFDGSSPLQRPDEQRFSATCSSVYLAAHIFPDVPINAGTFDPLHIKDPDGTFLYAKYPRPVSGAAEVSQRIAGRLCGAVDPLPDIVTAPAARGNFALGGYDPEKDRPFVMYQISGGGYGGNADHDGLTNGCSTIGISNAAD